LPTVMIAGSREQRVIWRPEQSGGRQVNARL
jgi:hypothetical protein